MNIFKRLNLFTLVLFVKMIQANEDLKIDGSQYISTSLISKPIHKQKIGLVILFKSTLSSCFLFFASGVNGDYIGLELVRGKLRYVDIFIYSRCTKASVTLRRAKLGYFYFFCLFFFFLLWLTLILIKLIFCVFFVSFLIGFLQRWLSINKVKISKNCISNKLL